MNGDRSGTRVEQLLDLRRRVDLELEGHGVRRDRRPTPAPRPHGDSAERLVLVPLSHVAVKKIREWAGQDPSTHGTLARNVVDAYVEAHRPGGAT